MANVLQIYTSALLADATYADNIQDNMSAQRLELVLRERITPVLASYIVSNFTVVSHIESDEYFGSGFDATVWRGTPGSAFAGKIFVSMQGTLGLQDFLTDVKLAASGNAGKQVTDMVNWWLRITTPLGSMATQLNGPPVPGTGLVSPQEIAAGVQVTGHSLGGYLASAFTRLLGRHANVVQTTTFNSAGFTGSSEQAFEQLAARLQPGYGNHAFPEPGNRSQLNVFAGHGINVTTNSFYFNQVGHRLAVFNENSASQYPNHSMFKLTDSLALSAAAERLDPSLSIAQLNILFEAASNAAAGSLEGLLDSLRTLLAGPVVATPIGDAGGDAASRVQFHRNLADLVASAPYQALAGLVNIRVSDGNLGALARSQFGALAALHSLSKIQLIGNGLDDARVDSLWRASHWIGLHDEWLADKAKNAWEVRTGDLAFSEQWLADRAALLAAIVKYNVADALDQIVHAAPGVDVQRVYSDVASGSTLTVRGNGSQPTEYVRFGSQGAETLLGGQLGDHLYGGGAADTVNGQSGNDYLEGNAGDDIVLGGDGNDTLLGGAGNDSLNGGKGNDSLLGGRGVDTYTFDSGWENATILDGDGLGQIVVTGLGVIDGVSAKKVAEGTWQTSDRRLNFTLVPIDVGHSDLFISFADRPDVIRIQNWQPEQLGIRLGTTAPPPLPSNPMNGDFSKKSEGGQFAFGGDGNYVANGVQVGAADLITGSTSADRILGLVGDDALLGRAGDDHIDGGDGSDILQGGLGADTLIGGFGTDIIYGSSNGSLFYPPSTSFVPPSTSDPIVLGRGFNWVMSSPGPDAEGIQAVKVSTTVDRDQQAGDAGNTIDAGPGQDFVLAGTGNDTVRGGDDGDEIHGMAGGDNLHGDGGNDRIYGDGPARGGADLVLRTLAAQHGSDLVSGGDGNDILLGQGGDDFVYGGLGIDKLWGDDRNTVDTPVSVNGNDHLDGGEDDDELVGGGRDDVLYGGRGGDALWGDSGGGDSLAPAYLDPAVHGADHLDGGDGDDYLMGEGGADMLLGGPGSDMLLGDNVEERLAIGFHGDDTLDGGDGNDSLAGQGGDDTLLGGAGDDYLDGDGLGVAAGHDGHDWLDGGSGADLLEGRGGFDVLLGGAGSDALRGGDGDDRLDGGPGADLLRGGAGDDTYVIRAGESTEGGFADYLIDDEGSDTVELRGVGVAALQIFRDAGNENLTFSWAANQGFVIEHGLQSSVTRIVTESDSHSFGELVGSRLGTPVAGRTVKPGGQLLGGAKADDLSVSHAGGIVRGGRASDAIWIGSADGATLVMALGDGQDRVSATARNLPASGQPAPQNVLQLSEGFFAGDVRLYKVNEQTFTLSLNDFGDGMTFYAIAGADDRPEAGTQPIDLIRFADGSALSWQQVLDRGVASMPVATGNDDVVVLSAVSDSFSAASGNDHVDGLAGNDTLHGDMGNDTLFGGAGDDALYAGRGVDSLFGGPGNDALFGGDLASDDFLAGGEGDDEYSFTFGYYTGVSGRAADTSLYSSDVYHARDSGYIGGGSYQTWTIDDYGGADRLQFHSPLVTPAATRVTASGGSFQLRTWNLIVDIRNAVDESGNPGPGNLETITFKDGTVWTMANLRSQSMQATAGDDSIGGFAADEAIDGGAGNDSLYGRGGNDTLLGSAGYDFLSGGSGDDLLDAGAGGGWLNGGSGNDTYRAKAGDGAIRIGTGWRPAVDDEGFDILQLAANPADVTVSFMANPSTGNFIGDQMDQVVVRWKDGSTTISIDAMGTRAGVCDVVEQIRFANGTTIDVGGFLATQLPVPTTGSDSIRLTSLDTTINAGSGNDTVTGRAGNDSIQGGAGNDLLDGGYGDDWLDGGAGDDRLVVGPGSNTVFVGPGSGRDTMTGGSATTVQLAGTVTPGDVRFEWRNLGFSSAYHSDGRWVRPAVAAADLRISLASGADWLDGRIDFVDDNQRVLGALRFGDNTTWDLRAILAKVNQPTSGNDLLFDGLRESVLTGGEGNDSLYGSTAGGILMGDGGNDVLNGGDGSDRLIGGPGNDALDGAAGQDTIVYNRGDGDDFFRTWSGGRAVIEFGEGILPGEVTLRKEYSILAIELAAGGAIRFESHDSRTGVPLEIRFADGTVWNEEQFLTALLGGTPGNDSIFGFREADAISGGAGNDQLRGLAGSDTIDGGEGDDWIFGFGTSGWDTPAEHDVLIGGSGDDWLVGGAGANTYRFEPGFGRDTVDNSAALQPSTVEFGAGILSGDIVCSYGVGGIVLRHVGTGDTVQIALEADDQVRFADGTIWTAAEVQARLVHAASASGDSLVGTAGADVIDALGGNDVVDAAGGNDLVYGGSGHDTLRGDAGNDTLVGGTGNDFLFDASGDDRYRFDAGDGQDEIADGSGSHDVLELGTGIVPGTTRILADTAGANAGRYRLAFDGSSDQVTMTGIDSVVFRDGTVWSRQYIDSKARLAVGTAGNDVLNGTAGPDSLNGLQGNDQLAGLAGNDTLDGGPGVDTMKGGSGDDVYWVDHTADVVTEASGEGNDSVFSAVSYVLSNHVESLELTGSAVSNATGNALANTLTGNDAGNVLSGLVGADTMFGGKGNDTYVVDNTGDRLVEAPGEGVDTVQSSITFTLGLQLENLTLTGSSAISGNGNDLANHLLGNSGNNKLQGFGGNDTLDGGNGADTLDGGAGDDWYVVDNSKDSIVEAAGQGLDTVLSKITSTLVNNNNLENLTLIGTSTINGTGNAMNNLLVGNAAANTLTGNGGNDTLDGGAGNDTLLGGAGADSYRFRAGSGIDTIQENDATAGIKDRVELLGGIRQSDIVFRQSGNSLELLLKATTDKLVIRDWYLSTAARVEEFAFSDGTVLVDAQVQSLVQAMAGFGATSLDPTSIQPSLRNHMVDATLLTPALA